MKTLFCVMAVIFVAVLWTVFYLIPHITALTSTLSK